MKVIAVLLCAGMLVAVSPCFADDTTASATPPQVDQIPGASTAVDGETQSGRVFTAEELAQFDGKDGRPAYVAVDGIVYDLSSVKAWKKGRHHGNTAGRDLTEIIKTKSPHKLRVLKKLKVVGTLKTE